MDDLKNPLLPPQRPNPITRIYNSTPQVVVNATRSKPVPKKSSLRPWIKVEAATGESSCVSLDKLTVMRLCDLPARDLRLLDPLFVYPSTILGREKAIVVNLEKIRCIIMCDEVLISVNEWDFVGELQRRIGSKADDLPFEFVALEIALEATCSYLDAQAGELEVEAYPLLDELTSKISTLNLERARRLKSKLVALTRRVQKVRDEIEQLMDDDGDMAELYLTEKKETNENFYALHGLNYTGTETSYSAPTTPVGSTPRAALKKLEKTFSSGKSFSRHDSSVRSVEDERKNIEQLEMLLEAYFVDIDNTHNKLMSLKEYIDDTEDFINIMLDNVRNQLIQFELVLTTATFVVAMFGVVAGIFGMNFPITFFDVPNAFNWVILISASVGFFIFFGFLWYFKHRRLIPI